MDINSLTIGEAKQLTQMFGTPNEGKSHSFEVGKSYFIRTVTSYFTGKLVAVTNSDIVLSDAAWIANMGRFFNTLQTGNLDEVEPYPNPVILNRDSIVDITEWVHKLPREQK